MAQLCNSSVVVAVTVMETAAQQEQWEDTHGGQVPRVSQLSLSRPEPMFTVVLI